MKGYRLFSSIAMLLSFMSVTFASSIPAGSGEGEVNDTVKVIERPASVTITRSNGGHRLDVAAKAGTQGLDSRTYGYLYGAVNSGDDYEADFSINVITVEQNRRKAKKRRWHSDSRMLESFRWGRIVNNGDDNFLNYGIELAMGNVLGASLYSPDNMSSFSLGLGLGWRRYNVSKSLIPELDDQNNLIYRPVESGVTLGRNQIWNFEMEVPLMYNQKLGDNFMFSLGAAAIYNANTWVKYETNCKGLETKNKFNGLNQTPFTYELRGRMMFGGAGVYCHYSPSPLFNGVRGPKMQTVTIGLEIIPSFSDN